MRTLASIFFASTLMAMRPAGLRQPHVPPVDLPKEK